MIEREVFRNNHLIDPALHIWGWQIPVYLFLGGLTAGVMILSVIAARRGESSRAMRWMPFAAPVLISAGMFALLLDLELKAHVFRFYTAFRPTSPMSWGAWILLLIYPATIALGVLRLEEDEVRTIGRLTRRLRVDSLLSTVRRVLAPRLKMLETANVVLGVLLGAYTGVLLGTLGARALWASMMLPLLFLVSGVSTGAALMMLFRLSDEERHTLVRWDLAAIGLEIAVLALFFIDLSTGGSRSREALSHFFGGSYTAAFWGFVVLAGLLLPLSMEWVEMKGRARATLVTPALLLIGGFALRFIFVAAGQLS